MLWCTMQIYIIVDTSSARACHITFPRVSVYRGIYWSVIFFLLLFTPGIRLYCRSVYFLFSLITCNHTNGHAKVFCAQLYNIDFFCFQSFKQWKLNNTELSSQNLQISRLTVVSTCVGVAWFCTIIMLLILLHVANYLFCTCTCMFVHNDMFSLFV